MPAEALKCKECREEYELEASYVCDRCFGPLEVELRPLGARRPRRAAAQDPGGPAVDLALRRTSCRSTAARRPALDAGLHAADPLRAARRAPRRGGGLGQERRRQPDPLVQGPGRERGGRQGAGARLRGRRLRLDREPRERGRRPCRRRRARLLRLRARRPRGAEDPRHRRLRHEAGRGGRQLRRRQPALHRAVGRASVGVRERQPAPVLRRGLQDAGIRGRRAARLRAARPGRVPGRLGVAVHEDRARASRSGSSWASWRARCPPSTARRPRAAARSPRRSTPATRSAGPVRPDTIAKSLAIGNPADGVFALDVARQTGARSTPSPTRRSSRASSCSPRRPASSPRPPAASPPRCCAKLAERGDIGADDRVVLYITGEGLKTLDAVRDVVSTYDVEPTLDSFNETVPVAGGERVVAGRSPSRSRPSCGP